ncbi:chitin-binding protein [Pseudomonas fluorescens]|uniref:Lytic polysaccharide monooxygenase n=1 Tax=Pseudomonas lactucae TaxID=2813360 RepID=A0A9X1C557_9PSED|nr:lytic polysaccharide monooxygenase [Pseudomonas lactucae]OPA83189.1 chitin-binding protein [Pseudomonas fluorescens]MBN2975382.1 lytic polysaccharide monooxygenase [Pseudomonas lactucae]MBN2989711.1 lytic polysaccharide monooxygenase [Pseudomonas lactucae]OPB04063.1 chitin-binding protein [Pseudomonas fluorescens]OPB15362.1 chitin-binding protein [Pseudomonas fluorescens]
MNNLQRRMRYLFRGLVAAAVLLPALASAHVATDIPVARQLHCYIQPDFWSGNPADVGCKELYRASGTYAGQQWNEVAAFTKDYNDQQAVERVIPNGKLCSAADPQKAGLDRPSANWYKTAMTPKNGFVEVRISGTAPHVSSIVKIYLSKPGFNPATTALKWSDLDLVHQETVTVARTDWGAQPPPVSGVSGFFKFNVAIPPGRTGDAILFSRFQRIDSEGEGFYNCSDITLHNDGPTPTPEWHAKGLFQPPGFNPKVGDKIHFRVFGSSKAHNEVVDIKDPVKDSNPQVWGPSLVQALAPYKTVVQIGEMKGASIVYNTAEPGKNQVYLADEQASKAMSIIPGDDPGPVNPAPPVARITGPTALKSGQAFTFSGEASSGSNDALLYAWTVPGMAGAQNESTVSGAAYTVAQPTAFKARLNVRDQQNGKTSQAEFDFTVTPASGGEEYPPYVPGGSHEAGKIYAHNGQNYKCKYTSWCSGSVQYYEPGKGLAWREAWDQQ